MQPCWGEIFDLIAHEYGYTFSQIRKMTMREIGIALDKINRRRHNDHVLQAAMHGAKNVNLIPSAAVVDVDRSAEKNILAEKVLKAAQERKQREFANRGK